MWLKLLGVIEIRQATYDEVRPVQQTVLRPDGPLPADTPMPDDWVHVAAVLDGRVIGAVSAGPRPWPHPDVLDLPEPQWQLRAMAVVPEHRGGVGAQLLAAISELAPGSLWAEARVAALGLYVRGGWRVVGQPWDKPGVGPHRWVLLSRRNDSAASPGVH